MTTAATCGQKRARRALERRKAQALALLKDHPFLAVKVKGVQGYGVCAGGRVRIDALHALERDRMVIRTRAGFTLSGKGRTHVDQETTAP